MDNKDADKRHGVQPTYKKVKGFQPLQLNWKGYFVDAIFRGGSKHSNYGDSVQNMMIHVVKQIRKNYSKDVPILLRCDAGFFCYREGRTPFQALLLSLTKSCSDVFGSLASAFFAVVSITPISMNLPAV